MSGLVTIKMANPMVNYIMSFLVHLLGLFAVFWDVSLSFLGRIPCYSCPP